MATATSRFALNVLRGGAVGTTEALPGISGGTVALIVGLYDRFIVGAGHVVSGIRLAVADGVRRRGSGRAGAEFRRADWSVLVPALIGMAVFLLVALIVVEPLLVRYTQYFYALFFGLVLASVWIPYHGSGIRWEARHWVTAASAALAAFLIMGLPGANLPTHPMVVFFAAAVAVCALVLPGLSGSFILLTIGLYQPTLAAVRSADMGYVAVFVLGAITGLALFVKVLQYLLEHKRAVTLVVLTGLMAGSLRALWPWQEEDRTIVAPTDVPITVLFMVLGFGIVAGALVWEHRRHARTPADAEASKRPINDKDSALPPGIQTPRIGK